MAHSIFMFLLLLLLLFSILFSIFGVFGYCRYRYRSRCHYRHRSSIWICYLSFDKVGVLILFLYFWNKHSLGNEKWNAWCMCVHCSCTTQLTKGHFQPSIHFYPPIHSINNPECADITLKKGINTYSRFSILIDYIIIMEANIV